MSLDLPSAGNTVGISRTLSNEFGADARGLALKVFSGTVLEAFRAKTVFYDNTGSIMLQKTLNGGHVAQWPVIGEDIDLRAIGTFTTNDSDADNDYTDAGDSVVKDDSGLVLGYHSPGDFITGRKVKMSEQTVRVDDILVSAIDVPFQDLDLSHFDVIQPFATKLGRSLAIDNDKKVATIALKAARMDVNSGIHAGGNSNVQNYGSTLANAYPDNSTGSSRFRGQLAELARDMDLDNVPEENRYMFIPPHIRMILRHEGSSWGHPGSNTTADTVTAGLAPGGPSPYGTAGWGIADRAIGMLEGFKLVVSNHLPDGHTSKMFEAAMGTDYTKYDYAANGSSSSAGRVAGIALCGAQEGSAAVGMVQTAGIRTVIEDDERRNVKFMKAQMMVGYDVVAPWCAGSIETH